MENMLLYCLLKLLSSTFCSLYIYSLYALIVTYILKPHTYTYNWGARIRFSSHLFCDPFLLHPEWDKVNRTELYVIAIELPASRIQAAGLPPKNFYFSITWVWVWAKSHPTFRSLKHFLHWQYFSLLLIESQQQQQRQHRQLIENYCCIVFLWLCWNSIKVEYQLDEKYLKSGVFCHYYYYYYQLILNQLLYDYKSIKKRLCHK